MKIPILFAVMILLLSWPVFLIYQNSKETKDEFISRCKGEDVRGLEFTFSLGDEKPNKIVCKRFHTPDEEFIVE